MCRSHFIITASGRRAASPLQNRRRRTSHELQVKSFLHSANSEYNYEVKSFRPGNAEPFNQFKIILNDRKLNPEIILSIDLKADGILDGIIKGSMTLEEIQALYSVVLKEGLKNSGLIEIGSVILVK